MVKLVLRGCSTRQISEALFIAEHTVQRHLTGVFDKGGVRSRSALVKRLFFEQLLPNAADEGAAGGSALPRASALSARTGQGDGGRARGPVRRGIDRNRTAAAMLERRNKPWTERRRVGDNIPWRGEPERHGPWRARDGRHGPCAGRIERRHAVAARDEARVGRSSPRRRSGSARDLSGTPWHGRIGR